MSPPRSTRRAAVPSKPARAPRRSKRSPEPWLPPGFAIDHATSAVREAIANVVQPIYDELVTGQPRALERSMGMSIVQLLCLELLEHANIGATNPDDPLANALRTQDPIEVYFRLVDMKLRASQMLLRVRKFHARTALADSTRTQPFLSLDEQRGVLAHTIQIDSSRSFSASPVSASRERVPRNFLPSAQDTVGGT